MLPASEVPSLVIPGTDRFRHDLREAKDVRYEEMLRECRAELDRCVDVLGRAPGRGRGDGPTTALCRGREPGFPRIRHGRPLRQPAAPGPRDGGNTRGPVDRGMRESYT